MKRFILGVTAVAFSAVSAMAADLPSRKAPAYLPPPPPPPLWTGFYVGLNAGYTFSGSNTATVSSFPLLPGFGPGVLAGNANATLAPSRDGFIGGGQIGYNWQFGPSFVAGIEADIQGVAGAGSSSTINIPGIIVPAAATGISVANRLDYLGTVRGRLGWLFTPTLLLYGTGGLAYGGIQSTTTIYQPGVDGFGVASFADTRVGWTAGGGVEWMFWPNWSAKVEYLYYDLGSLNYTTVASSPLAPGAYLASQTNTRNDGHIVRAGLNYHFNWGAPAPVVAKY